MADAGTLFDICSEYLQACYDALVASPGGQIDRAFVSPGVPAWDCWPQLTVHAGGPMQGDTAPLQPPLQPMHRIDGTGMVNLVALTATVLRCAPIAESKGESVQVPSAKHLDEAAQEMLGDVWSIWNYVATAKRAGTLWGPKSRELIFDPAVALSAAGGIGGWQIQVRVQIDGYTPALIGPEATA